MIFDVLYQYTNQNIHHYLLCLDIYRIKRKRNKLYIIGGVLKSKDFGKKKSKDFSENIQSLVDRELSYLLESILR